MITISRERYDACIDELMPLCEQVFNLVEAGITGLPLDMDHDVYASLDDNDNLHCLIMRLNGKAVGMHWVVISPMARHKGHNQAHTDVIFVLPEYRKYSNNLIEYSQNYIRERASFWTLANLAPNDVATMWQRKGFIPIETIMFKKLGE